MSVDLSLLMPEFADNLKEFVMEANYQGIKCDVFCGYRSIEDQNALYTQGRTTPGKIITDAKGGYSWHQWCVAADVVPKDTNDNWTWNVDPLVWKQLADIAAGYGLTWEGSWSGQGAALGDTDHFELTNGLSIETAVQLNDVQKVWQAIRANGQASDVSRQR